MGASTGSKFTRSTNLSIPASNKVCIRFVGEILHDQAERQFAFSNHTLNAGNPEITMAVRLNGTSSPNRWAFLYGTTGAYYHWYTSKQVKSGKGRCIIALYDYASPATCRFLYLASDDTWMDETVAEQFGLTPSGPAAMSHPAVIGCTNDDLYPMLGDINEITVWDSHPSTAHLQGMIGQTDGVCRSPGRYSSRSNVITHVPLFTSATLTDDGDASTWTKSGAGSTATDYSPVEMSGRSLLQPADGVGQDAILRTGSPTTVAGTGTTGAVGHNSTGTVLFVRIWNQFAKDSRLASGDTILYGERTLTCTIASSGIHTMITKGCTRASLDETGVCHSYYTGTTAWTTAGGDMGTASVSNTLPAATGTLAEVVTSILQERFDAGNATFGFISYRQNESSADSDRATFALSENATAADRPKLEYWWARAGVEVPTVSVPTVTSRLQNIAYNDATVQTTVSGDSITARGVCWNTSANPTTSNNKTTDSTGSGDLVSRMTPLNASTLYYARAYATNAGGTTYSTQMSFTTPPNFDAQFDPRGAFQSRRQGMQPNPPMRSR